MNFEVTYAPVPANEQELLADLKAVAEQQNLLYVSLTQYKSFGKFSVYAFVTRFGSWKNALVRAGFNVNYAKDATVLDLFNNLYHVWVALGEQPKYDDMRPPLSEYSPSPYIKFFGSWKNAVCKFSDYMRLNEETLGSEFLKKMEHNEYVSHKHTTGRKIGLQLRYKVLERDRFCCCSCGASPIKDPNVKLHVDHILAYSNGGETEIENLQTLCMACNVGKSNLFNC